MENQPLLTVIVPCYHVENCMDKCILSLLNQTYSNLEILLIDDGSINDNTGKKCDEWQEKEPRIRAIHKKQNEGISCGRKTGVENANGEYIAFADADDWTDPNMYFDMINALLSTNSDIADCDFWYVYEDGSKKSKIENYTGSYQVHQKPESVLILLRDNATYRTNFGTKVYKKSIFDNFSFPKGSNWGEDYYNHELYHRASQIVFVDNAYYFYFQRSDSVTKMRPGNLQKDLKNLGTLCDAIYDRYYFVVQNPEYHSVLPLVKYMAICSGIYLLRTIFVHHKYFSKEYCKTKVKQIRLIPALKEYKLPRLIKIEWNILKVSSNLYKIMRLLFVMIIRITNKLKITHRQLTHTASDTWYLWNRD